MNVGSMKITQDVSRQRLGAALVALAALLLIWQVSAGAQELERSALETLSEGERYSLQVELAQTAAERRKRSEEHTSELQSRGHLVCRLLLEKKKIPR